jgi:hypothetical protein
MSPQARLILLKALHTAIWAFFAGCVVAIPIAAWMGDFTAALTLIGFVALEVAVLALNGWRCPLQRIAAGYTSDRRANFDIYLPAWLAGRTMVIFGPLFGIGLVLTGALWWGSRR